MRFILLLISGCCLISCSNVTNQHREPYPYTLKDFSPHLRQDLQKIITGGSFNFDTWAIGDSIQGYASDGELLKMTKCEHPLIRAFALTATLERPAIDHYNVLMHHLDDTARIAWYGQCSWRESEYVSDYFLRLFDKWKTIEQKQKTIHEVLTKHSYLGCAYTILDRVKADPRYYDVIRKMAQRDMGSPEYLEMAWLALAEYKKPEDPRLISQLINNYSYNFGYQSFLLMQEFPDTAYLAVLEKYYQRRFYREICDQKHNEHMFLSTLLAYKDERCVRIADLIRKIDPAKFCHVEDKKTIQRMLYESLLENECKLYQPLLMQLDPLVGGMPNQTIRIMLPPDTMRKPDISGELTNW